MENYSDIYERMKKKYEQVSGSEFDEASDIAIRMKVLAGEIYNAQVNADWLKRQMFVTTASGEYLDYFASQRGLERKQATKAQGELTFFISAPKDHDIVIPIGSVVATNDSEPLRYRTTETEVIRAGNTLVSVYAEAEKPGKNWNIEIGYAVVAVSVPSEIEYVRNREAFVGGTDAESDNELRERIKSTFVSPSNGTNAAYYESLALSVEGISKAGVVPKLRGIGTVNVYVYGDGKDASSTAIANAQSLISKNRELNVDVKVYAAQVYKYNLDITVKAKSGFQSSVVKQKCGQAFTDYINSLPIGGKLYLSGIGKYIMDTGCVENYEFNTSMSNDEISGTQCFGVGSMDIEVV